MPEITFQMTGVKELDDALSYLKDKSAKRIGRACSRKMAAILAKGMRPMVPASIAASTMMGADRGIGSRATKSALSNIKLAKAGVAVGPAFKKGGILKRQGVGGKRKGVGVSARNLHWFAAGTQDRYTGAKSIAQGKGRKRKLVPTGNPRKFTGRINKAIWGGFVQRGAQAMRTTAIEEAKKLFNKMVQEEAWASRTGMSPVTVE